MMAMPVTIWTSLMVRMHCRSRQSQPEFHGRTSSWVQTCVNAASSLSRRPRSWSQSKLNPHQLQQPPRFPEEDDVRRIRLVRPKVRLVIPAERIEGRIVNEEEEQQQKQERSEPSAHEPDQHSRPRDVGVGLDRAVLLWVATVDHCHGSPAPFRHGGY